MFAASQFLKRHFVIALIASVGVIASILVSVIVYRLVDERLHYEFESETDERVVTIGNETLSVAELMHALNGLYAASQHVSAKSFTAFSEKIFADIEYVDAALWLPRVNPADRNRFEQQLKAEGITPYRIQQVETEQTDTSKQHTAFPVHYFYSKKKASIPYAFDLASSVQFESAMQKALQVNDIAASSITTPPWKAQPSACSLALS